MKITRKPIQAAESDYIKIGNRIYPKDMSGFAGYESPEEVSRRTRQRYDAEKKAEAEERARQEAAERGKALREAVEQAIADNPNPEHPLNPYFDVLVPAQGKADTVAGELVRAMMRLLYRDWNDGDVFYSGYGLETCGRSAQYLMENGPDTLYETLYEVADNDIREDEYTRYLNTAAEYLIDYLEDHPELYGDANDVDSGSYPSDKVEELAPTYDYDFEIPDEVLQHIERGNISLDDVDWEVSSWDVCSRCNCNVNVFDSYVEITELPEDEYNELEGNGYRYLEEYGSNLTEEYGDPYEDEWDEDEDYDEDIEESVDIMSSVKWSKLSGADQMAISRLDMYISQADDLEHAVSMACNSVAEGNAEPEYEDEDFYLEEPDYDRVLQYAKEHYE